MLGETEKGRYGGKNWDKRLVLRREVEDFLWWGYLNWEGRWGKMRFFLWKCFIGEGGGWNGKEQGDFC